MRKLFTFITLLFVIVHLSGFSSCHGPQYEESERDAMEENGRRQMQMWLDEHLEGAEVLSATAFIEIYLSGPYYLTDSVYGSFRYGDEERLYEIEVEENEVNLACDTGLLTDELKPYVLETLGFSAQAEECRFMELEGGVVSNIRPVNNQYMHMYENLEGLCYLPGELVLAMEKAGYEVTKPEKEEEGDSTGESTQQIIWSDKAHALMRDFVRDLKNRQEINVSGSLTVPEDVELKLYDMAYFREIRELSGLYFNGSLQQQYAKVQTDSGRPTYERRTRKPLEDFFIEYTEEYLREEVWSDKIRVSEEFTHDVRALSVEHTVNGYRFVFEKPEEYFYFTSLAD